MSIGIDVMSLTTDYCLLCQTFIKNSANVPLQIENDREHQNDLFGSNIKLITLCDILKVSVNAAENYLDSKVSLCTNCDSDIKRISKLLREIKIIKKNLSKTMNIVKTKLQVSLSISTSGGQLFYDVRQGILSDISNILGLSNPLNISVKTEQIEFYFDFEDDNSYETETENKTENAATFDFGAMKICKALRMQPRINQKGGFASRNVLNHFSGCESVQEKEFADIDDNSNDDQKLSSLNSHSDPDFSRGTSSDSEDSDDEEYVPTQKRKSLNKYSPRKRQKPEVNKVSDPDVVLTNQEERVPMKNQVQEKTGTSVQKAKYRFKGAKWSHELIAFHRSLKKNKKVSPCSICEKDVPRNDLSKHMQEVHGEGETIKVFTNQEKKVPKKKELQNKTRTSVQKGDKSSEELVAFHQGLKNKRVATCRICEKNVPRNDLSKHVREVHGEGATIKCKLCDKIYKSTQGYDEHMLTHSEDFHPFICSHCGKSHLSKKSLIIHENTHVLGKIYSCDICHKTFYAKYNLNAHMESHSTERKHVCELCGKTFKFTKHFRSHLRHHMQVAEQGEITFQCDQCDKNFKTRGSVRMHKNRYHCAEKRIHQCTVCGKILSRADHLRTHQKIHQNTETLS